MNGVDGIDRVMDVVVSPDGRGVYAVGEWENGYHLYAVGYYDSAIAVFQVKTPADTDTDDETDNGLTIAPAGDGGGGCFLKAL